MAPIWSSQTLFDLVIEAKWDKIVEIYENNPDAHTTKITKSGDTALHLAVQDGKEEVFMKLVDSIVKSHDSHHPDKWVEVLGLKNKRGDTPLHFAASMENIPMCYWLAHNKPELIGIRNDEGETPLFVAAANGKKEAFLCLHSLIPDIPEAPREKTGTSYSRRTDGDTFLHCALEGDYFDLAFQIIHRFPGLGNRVNEQGYSPLHLLASKPSAFRSGSRFGIIDRIIYNCIFVNRLTVDPEKTSNFHCPTTPQTENKRPSTTYPENYLVCVYDLFRGLFQSLCCWTSIAEIKTDAESQVPVRQTNYDAIFDFLKLVRKAMFIILVVGHHRKIEKMLKKKKKHTWSIQLMEELLKESSGLYEHNGQEPGNLHLNKDGGSAPYDIRDPEEVSLNKSPSDAGQREIGVDGAGGETKRSNLIKNETAILIAAKNGIIEMVQGIFNKFPMAINDINADHKNIVLLAVENRQTDVYKLLRKLLKDNDGAFRKVDNKGNSALHLAARLGGHHPWLIPGAALQMQWELKWYEFVKKSKPDIFPKYNKKGQTARHIFTETHESLVEKSGQWLTTTSESCSLVAALIATVAFATATAVPGGVDQSKGTPTLEKQPAFDIFAIAALVALSLSVTSLVMFLSILTSRHQEKDFRISLPRKLLVGLTSLFLAIVAMLVSFCAGHFFVLKDDLKYKAIFVYAVTCLPITMFYLIVQFPLYCDLVWAAMNKVPQRSY